MKLSSVGNWFSANSKALQGAAALAVLLATLMAGSRWLLRNYGSDLNVQVDWSGASIPLDIADWTRAVIAPVDEVAEFHSSSDSRQPYVPGLDNLVELARAPAAKLLAKKSFVDRIRRLNIMIHNNTNENVSGLRLRVGDLPSFWRVFLAGEFLTTKEADDFYERVGDQKDYSSVVLPDLPTLPANATLVVSVYGDGEFANVQLAAPGHSSRITKTIKIEDSWLLAPVTHHVRALPPNPLRSTQIPINITNAYT